MKDERSKYMLKYEWERFIEACPDKYKLFWEVCINSGTRISEILNICVDDIIFEENKIIIETLKRKDHPRIAIIIPEKIVNRIKEYIAKNSINNKLWNFTRQYAWKMFKKICHAAGLNPKYSPHSFRHTHGMMIADITNGNMLKIRDRLRHATTATTEIYVRTSEKAQKELANNIEAYFK